MVTVMVMKFIPNVLISSHKVIVRVPDLESVWVGWAWEDF